VFRVFLSLLLLYVRLFVYFVKLGIIQETSRLTTGNYFWNIITVSGLMLIFDCLFVLI